MLLLLVGKGVFNNMVFIFCNLFLAFIVKFIGVFLGNLTIGTFNKLANVIFLYVCL